MPHDLTLRIIITNAPQGVMYGLQQGAGSKCTTVQQQVATTQDLVFTFPIVVKGTRQDDAMPKLSGSYVQGPTGNKFVYIVIGTYAGQANSPWARRMKVPLVGITWSMFNKNITTSKHIVECLVEGTGKDGGPTCATVKPFGGWHVASSK